MICPHKTIRGYLDQLVKNFAFLKLSIKEFTLIDEWKSDANRINTLIISHTFFKAVLETFLIHIIIELYKIVANPKKESKTLFDWLDKAYEHSSQLKPKELEISYESESRYIDLDINQYKEAIVEQRNTLNNFSGTIKTLKKLREKTTHSDPDYFMNRGKVFKKHKIDIKHINEMVDCVEEILSYHHQKLFYSSMDFNIKTSGHVDNILKHAEAFQKIRSDKKVIEAGINPIEYLRNKDIEF